MRFMSDKDRGNFMAILDSIEKISEYVEGINCGEDLYSKPMVFDAVLMNFINIGEMALRISDETKDKNSGIPWKDIVGLRNIVAHDYLGIDAEEIWQIIEDDLRPLSQKINEML